MITRQLEDEYDIADARAKLRDDSYIQLHSLLICAGFRVLRHWQLVNPYWPDSPKFDDVRQPWWLFATDIGLIQIGWRKRVISIDWSETKIRTIITEDNVTKLDTMVHAWSIEKALEYLKALKQAAQLEPQP